MSQPTLVTAGTRPWGCAEWLHYPFPCSYWMFTLVAATCMLQTYYPGRAWSIVADPELSMEFCTRANIGKVHLSAAKSALKLFQTCCCSWQLLLWTTGCSWSRNLTMHPGIFLKSIGLMGQPFFVTILSCSIFLWSHLIILQICIPYCAVLKLQPPCSRVMATYFCSATKRSLDTSDGTLSWQSTPGHHFGNSSCVIADAKEDCTSSSSTSSASVRSCEHVRALKSSWCTSRTHLLSKGGIVPFLLV